MTEFLTIRRVRNGWTLHPGLLMTGIFGGANLMPGDAVARNTDDLLSEVRAWANATPPTPTGEAA